MTNRFEIHGEEAVIFLKYRGVEMQMLIDAKDLPILMAHRGKFRASRDNKTFYALGSNGTKPFKVHRLLLDVQPGIEVDHENRNGLDNRRSNIRLATHSLNQLNRGRFSNNTSGHTGVWMHKPTGLWCAERYINRKRFWLGRFNSAPEAAQAIAEHKSQHPGLNPAGGS